MKEEEIRHILLHIGQLRQEAKGKLREEQVRLLIRRKILRNKIARDGDVLDDVPTEELLREVNEIYKKKIDDRLTEHARCIRTQLLWAEINRRRGDPED